MKIVRNKYDIFLNYLDSVSHILNDLDMRNSRICEVSNGSVAIVDADMTTLFPEPVDMRYVMLKTKLPLLQLFVKSPDDIELNCDSENIKISDEFSNITIRQAASEYITNNFIEPNDLNKKINIDYNNDVYFSTILSKIILERISVVSANFQTMYLLFSIKNNTGSIELISSDKANKSTIISNINCNKTIKDMQINFSVFPFQTRFDNDVNLDLCFNNINGKDNSVLRLQTILKGVQTSFYLKGTVIS